MGPPPVSWSYPASSARQAPRCCAGRTAPCHVSRGACAFEASRLASRAASRRSVSPGRHARRAQMPMSSGRQDDRARARAGCRRNSRSSVSVHLPAPPDVAPTADEAHLDSLTACLGIESRLDGHPERRQCPDRSTDVRVALVVEQLARGVLELRDPVRKLRWTSPSAFWAVEMLRLKVESARTVSSAVWAR